MDRVVPDGSRSESPCNTELIPRDRLHEDPKDLLMTQSNLVTTHAMPSLTDDTADDATHSALCYF